MHHHSYQLEGNLLTHMHWLFECRLLDPDSQAISSFTYKLGIITIVYLPGARLRNSYLQSSLTSSYRLNTKKLQLISKSSSYSYMLHTTPVKNLVSTLCWVKKKRGQTIRKSCHLSHLYKAFGNYKTAHITGNISLLKRKPHTSTYLFRKKCSFYNSIAK